MLPAIHCSGTKLNRALWAFRIHVEVRPRLGLARKRGKDRRLVETPALAVTGDELARRIARSCDPSPAERQL